jgi:hypothetical protein
MPEHRFADDIRASLKDARLNVVSERITLIDSGITDREFLFLYNSLRRVSAFDEIEYFNTEDEKWRPLFEGSFHVSDPDSTKPLPDPVVEQIPAEESILVHQGLPPFGPSVSRYTYRHIPGTIHFSAENLTRVTYKGFPVVGPGEIITHFLIIREPDYVLVYGVGGAQVFSFFGLLSGKIEVPFESRTTGLFDWYSNNYLEPLQAPGRAPTYRPR